jgi:hypothetical protein
MEGTHAMLERNALGINMRRSNQESGMSIDDVKSTRGLCALLALVCMGLFSAAQAAGTAAAGTARGVF